MVQFESEEDVEDTLHQAATEIAELLGRPEWEPWATSALQYVAKVRDAIGRESWPEAVFYALWFSVARSKTEHIMTVRDNARRAGRQSTKATPETSALKAEVNGLLGKGHSMRRALEIVGKRHRVSASTIRRRLTKKPVPKLALVRQRPPK